MTSQLPDPALPGRVVSYRSSRQAARERPVVLSPQVGRFAASLVSGRVPGGVCRKHFRFNKCSKRVVALKGRIRSDGLAHLRHIGRDTARLFWSVALLLCVDVDGPGVYNPAKTTRETDAAELQRRRFRD